ncbi:hypothetical protein JCM6882_002285 [Rhodosporidiobolus microsporus]
MLIRARNARTLARSASAALSPPVKGRCRRCSTAGSGKGGEATGGTVRVARPRPPAVQPIDWSQPSTSAVPYSPSPSPSQSRAYSTSSFFKSNKAKREDKARDRPRRPKREADTPPPSDPPEDPFPLLDSLLDSASEAERNKALPQLLVAFDRCIDSADGPSLTRERWLALFDRVAALYPSPQSDETATDTRSFISAVLKRLRDFALAPPRSWRLRAHQLRFLFRVRLEKEEREQRVRAGQHGALAGGAGARATRERWAYLDELGREVSAGTERKVKQADRGKGELAAPFDPDTGTLEEWRRRRGEWADTANLLERYSLALSNRLPHPPSPAHPLSTTDLQLALRASSALRTAHSLKAHLAASTLSPSLDPASIVADLDPHVDLAASLPLPFIFASPEEAHRDVAFAHLRSALARGKLLTVSAIRSIVTAYHGDPPFPSSSPTTSSSAASAAAEAAAAAAQNEAEDEASYLRARQILSSVCDDPCPSRRARVEGTSKLDELLRLRLERVERVERLEREPTLAFVGWLGGEMAGEWEKRGGFEEAQRRSRTIEERQAALDAALRYWEASQVLGRSEWDVGALKLSRSPVAKLLNELVRRACELEREARVVHPIVDGKTPPPSACVETAVRVAVAYLPPQLLTTLSVPLLQAVTVFSHSPSSALALFEALTAPSPPAHTPSALALSSAAPTRPYAPFTWTASLLPSFTTLFQSAASPSSARADPSLAMRLYLSWTACGLSFPVGLWTLLWRAAGRRGHVEEVMRLVRDWEETGRGPVGGRIARLVVEAAAEAPPRRRPAGASPPRPEGSFVPPEPSFPSSTLSVVDDPTTPSHVLPALRLLHFFRSRYAPSPTSPPAPHLLHPSGQQAYLLVPLAAYASVLRLLARSHADRRPAFRQVWKQLLLDGHRPSSACFNAAIAVNVWRPDPGFGVKDVDAAGVVFNAMVAESQRRRTGKGGEEVEEVKPDRDTYSLLVHGLLRVAAAGADVAGGGGGARRTTTRRRRRIVLEAALRTFDAAHAPSSPSLLSLSSSPPPSSSPTGAGGSNGAPGPGVRGHQTALLVRLLAGEGRFEDAKRCQEGWWRGFVARCPSADPGPGADPGAEVEKPGGKKGRETTEDKERRELQEEAWEVERVRGEVERVEGRWMGVGAREGGRKAGRGVEQEEEGEEGEVFETVGTGALDFFTSPPSSSSSPSLSPSSSPPRPRSQT